MLLFPFLFSQKVEIKKGVILTDCPDLNKYTVPKIERPQVGPMNSVLTGMLRSGQCFCEGYALRQVCLWNANSPF